MHNKKSVAGSADFDHGEAIHRSFFLEKDFFDRAYTSNNPVIPSKKVIGGIIPHHLLASHVIAGFFQGIESRQSPPVVVVIGPDHLDRSAHTITTSRGNWETPYGILPPAPGVVDALEQSKLVGIDERLFSVEHSISAEVAFIRRSFPRTTFVPITLKSGVSPNDAVRLGQLLAEILPTDALVLASVDFAHYVDHNEAQRQNQVNIPLLESLNIQEASSLYVDSIPTVQVLFAFLQDRHSSAHQVVSSLTGADITGDYALPEVTSYITMYYFE
ncbi:MAG: AmmeMemoRadiSam system protein B [Patescibacteria group bacterium]